MRPTKPGWYWFGKNWTPEVVCVDKDYGYLTYRKVGDDVSHLISWTIDEMWGDEIKIRETEIEYRKCNCCGAWNRISSDEYIVDCKCSCEIEVTPNFIPWPEWAISAMEEGFKPPDGWNPNWKRR